LQHWDLKGSLERCPTIAGFTAGGYNYQGIDVKGFVCQVLCQLSYTVAEATVGGFEPPTPRIE